MNGTGNHHIEVRLGKTNITYSLSYAKSRAKKKVNDTGVKWEWRFFGVGNQQEHGW
jgi:hypothetical protein